MTQIYFTNTKQWTFITTSFKADTTPTQSYIILVMEVTHNLHKEIQNTVNHLEEISEVA